MDGRTILEKERFALMLERLCHQLLETHGDFHNSCLVGIQEGGAKLGSRIHARLTEILHQPNIPYGQLDVTFYRDDVRIRTPLDAHPTRMDFLVEGKKVILVDDVLYTGRTVRAALTALLHYGRAESIQLLALVDRHFKRHLPISADYVGMAVDTIEGITVKVEWGQSPSDAKVVLYGGGLP